jgi:FAD:protein FMN transferase
MMPPAAPVTVYHQTFPAMHSRFSLVLPGVEPPVGEALAGEVEALVRDQERLMSRFDALGPVAGLNRRAALEPVEVSPPLWELLQICRRHWQLTAGAFDTAQVARTELWREAATRGMAPSAGELAAAGRQCGFHQVLFDDATRTVQFASSGLKLDLGGIGKGVALDAAVATLREAGVTSGFLSFGESSVAVIGTHPAGPYWPVGVADPSQPGRSWHQFALRDAAMSTSGNRTEQGHIIDPRDGRLVSGRRILSVACSSAVDAEVLSTALLVVPVAERATLLTNYLGAQAVEVVYESDDEAWRGRLAWQHPA